MMKDDGTSIRSLSLEFFDPLSELEPKYLFAAFEKFEAVEFWDCEDAPRDVMTTFFKTSTNLKKLLLREGFQKNRKNCALLTNQGKEKRQTSILEKFFFQ